MLAFAIDGIIETDVALVQSLLRILEVNFGAFDHRGICFVLEVDISRHQAHMSRR
jgi:hypothetical protein